MTPKVCLLSPLCKHRDLENFLASQPRFPVNGNPVRNAFQLTAKREPTFGFYGVMDHNTRCALVAPCPGSPKER